jgi:poly(3-hydroxybutyrate) depolymerase
MPNQLHWMLLALALPLAAARSQAADREALPPADERRAGADEHKRYFLIAPRAKKPPKEGCALLLVLPGGDGSAQFKAFVQRIAANATDDDWVVAHLIAPQWTPEQAQNLVWPTAQNPAAAMKFSTEQFLAAVIRDVEQVHTIDPARVFTLAWSSSGPAAYAASLDPAIGITGTFVAMSV